jgi:ribosomal protein S18 acetylase RimI-like enzyme
MLIRQANSKDIDQITKLGIALLDMHTVFDGRYYAMEQNKESEFRRWVENQLYNNASFIIVSENENGIINGYISGFIKSLFPWFKTKAVGHISFLIIDPLYRNNKIGKLLEQEAINWFKNKKLSYVELYVDELNSTGKIVWEKYGYIPFKKFLIKNI